MMSKKIEGKIGLALGGGAALGIAHIGVLKALKEKNIEIGWIAGTSIGSLIASLYCFDEDLDHLNNLAIETSWQKIAGISFSTYGAFSNSKLEKFLKEHIGDKNFEESKIPLSIVATNIANGKKVVLSKGSVSKAVMASTAIPGVFEPIEIENELLVDGGVVENVPVTTIEEMGAETIIAVDLNASHVSEKPKNIVGVLINSFHFLLANSTKSQIRQADILIQPELSKFSMVRLNNAENLIESGYNAAMELLNDN